VRSFVTAPKVVNEGNFGIKLFESVRMRNQLYVYLKVVFIRYKVSRMSMRVHL